ncbi:MAG: hypothetical protein ABI599_15870 [Flavobacteriales bacterium]
MPTTGAKRALAWLLLCALVWQFVRFASFEVQYAVVHHAVKLKLKAGVPLDERTYFTFSLVEYNALHWLERGKEFSIGDDFFDVIGKTMTADGKVRLACMNDHQEAELFTGLARMVEEHMDQRGDGANDLMLPVFLAKHWCNESAFLILPTTGSVRRYFPQGSRTVLLVHSTPELLPPRG